MEEALESVLKDPPPAKRQRKALRDKGAPSPGSLMEDLLVVLTTKSPIHVQSPYPQAERDQALAASTEAVAGAREAALLGRCVVVCVWCGCVCGVGVWLLECVLCAQVRPKVTRSRRHDNRKCEGRSFQVCTASPWVSHNCVVCNYM